MLVPIVCHSSACPHPHPQPGQTTPWLTGLVWRLGSPALKKYMWSLQTWRHLCPEVEWKPGGSVRELAIQIAKWRSFWTWENRNYKTLEVRTELVCWERGRRHAGWRRMSQTDGGESEVRQLELGKVLCNSEDDGRTQVLFLVWWKALCRICFNS